MARTSGTKERQQKAGIPAKKRGQQTGFAGNPDQNRIASAETPALRGRRKSANRMFGDPSSQEAGSTPAAPRTNSPSTIATPMNRRAGETSGETAFKKRMKRAGK